MSIMPCITANAENSMIENLSSRYNLVDIDIVELPDNVQPIELSSDELDTFLQSITNETTKTSYSITNDRLRTPNTTTRTEYVLHGVFAKTTMYSYITTNSKDNISNVSGMGVSFSGLTAGVDITDIITSYVVSSTNRTVTLYYDYNKNYYLLVDGFVKLFTTSYRASYKWTVNEGCHSGQNETY